MTLGIWGAIAQAAPATHPQRHPWDMAKIHSPQASKIIGEILGVDTGVEISVAVAMDKVLFGNPSF